MPRQGLVSHDTGIVCFPHHNIPIIRLSFWVLISVVTREDRMYFPQYIASSAIFCTSMCSCGAIVIKMPKMQDLNLSSVNYVSLLMTHMTSCTKYPIGSNALWEVHRILLVVTIPMIFQFQK